VPGHFTRHEWLALGIWAALGIVTRASREKNSQPQPDLEMVDASG